MHEKGGSEVTSTSRPTSQGLKARREKPGEVDHVDIEGGGRGKGREQRPSQALNEVEKKTSAAKKVETNREISQWEKGKKRRKGRKENESLIEKSGLED